MNPVLAKPGLEPAACSFQAAWGGEGDAAAPEQACPASLAQAAPSGAGFPAAMLKAGHKLPVKLRFCSLASLSAAGLDVSPSAGQK